MHISSVIWGFTDAMESPLRKIIGFHEHFLFGL